MSPVRLTDLTLEITNACHHRCVHCSTYGGIPRENELTQDERLDVLRQACALGLIELRLLGGEPLLRKEDTFELLAEANRLGVKKALIYTSAAENDFGWLTTLRNFAPMEVSAEASIYSATQAVHDGITVKPLSFERLLSNSKEAVQVGFDLNWNFVWMKPNFWELGPVIALASKIGIRRVRILRLMLNGRARENRDTLELPAEMEIQCETILNLLTSRYPDVFIAHSKPLVFQLGRSNHDHVASCSAGKGQIILQADGRVLPCIGMKDTPQLEIGNVRIETIEDIFSRARGMNFPGMSQEYRECPAIQFQKTPELIQLTPGRI